MLAVILSGMAAASIYSLCRYGKYGMHADDQDRREEDQTDTETQTEAADQADSSETKSSQETTGNTELLIHADTDRTIRVRILGNDSQAQTHQKVTAVSAGGMTVCRGRERTQVAPGEVWEIFAEELSLQNGTECMILEPAVGGTVTLPELTRSQKEPSYAGKMFLYPEDGGIALINEVTLEEYLCSVVSSEMPSDYPREALCAQAVCARTYALLCMEEGEEENTISDLDDSVSWQVYNNYRKNEASVEAVERTRGVILNCSEVLYYSTSCQTELRTDLGDDASFRRFLQEEPEDDAEYGSPWVRWSVSLSEQEILNHLNREYECDWERLDKMKVQRRTGDGQVQEMLFSDGKEEVLAEGEYRIRKLLSPENVSVILRDGEAVTGLQLLPSAYFCLDDRQEDSWHIMGGGYGHGRGMSQYGAAAMASEGADYREILEYYYGDE